FGEPDVVTQVVTAEVRIVEVVTATPDPEMTEEVMVQIITATSEPSATPGEIGEVNVVVPTLTPIGDLTIATATTEVLATSSPDIAVTTNTQSAGNADASIPPQLAQIMSQMVNIPGGL